MAHVTLSQEDIKALEQTRQRLYQLSNNIASLKGDVLRSNPLPQWHVGTCRLNFLPPLTLMLTVFMQVVPSNIRFHPGQQCSGTYRPPQ
jgi:Mediator of RNA polymerase II transcription complex subunit 8